MIILDTLKMGALQLEKAGVPNADYDALQLLAHVLHAQPLMLRMDPQRVCPSDSFTEYMALISRRAGREPLQYILGTTGFMGFDFLVSEQVLIPRPDTEILCETAITFLHPGDRVLDLGTGSGALAIALAKLCNVQVTAVDISESALQVAKENARHLGADVTFLQSDLYANVHSQFHLIVSNPPYLTDGDMKELQPEVRWEPSLALHGGPDGLEIYRRIIQSAGNYLCAHGTLVLEIGWHQKDAIEEMLSPLGKPFSRKDYGGNWRVVGVTRNE